MATFIQLDDLEREETPPRFREDLRQQQQPAAAADELRATLDALGLARAARLFATSSRNLRRWRDGTRRIPHGIGIVIGLLTAKMITVDEIEAVIPVNTRPEPPAPVEPAPEEQSASARARTATRADPGPTTGVVKQVCALTAGTCRWPLGDIRDRDFHFCSRPTVRGSYCECHALQAYLASRPGRKHGVHVGFVVRGHHGRPPIPGALSAAGPARAPTSRATFPDSVQPPA